MEQTVLEPFDFSTVPCEKCGAVGATEEGADIFVAALCRMCFDKLWREYLSAVFEREVSEDEAKRYLDEYYS